MTTTSVIRLASMILPICAVAGWALGAEEATETSIKTQLPSRSGIGIGQGIVVRTTENVTQGGWVWLLNQAQALGIRRIDLLVKQDEDEFHSARTGQTLQSGELLLPLPGEKCAKGWENVDWLREMLARAKEKQIEIWAWWPCFHDAQAAARFPAAKYTNERHEQFVDPAVPGVAQAQTALIAKLLATYPFDGVSLDWIRYDGWYAGSSGPLGHQFAGQYNFQWSQNALDNEYSKARWYETRAKFLAYWVQELVASMRTVHPRVRWGAFLLPWQFSDASQNYGMLGRAGLDFMQPMGYWGDWKLSPEWVGNRLLAQHSEFGSGTTHWLTLGADAPLAETKRAFESIPFGVLAGLSWFTYGTWEQKTFDQIRKVTQESAAARQLFGFENPPKVSRQTSLAGSRSSVQRASHELIQPKIFPDDSSLWAAVCLAELYKKGALNSREDIPAIPVLALHRFAEGKAGSQTYFYTCSTEYLDNLMKFIVENGFTVCPLSRLQGYLITRDSSYLPPKPLVLTIDDGCESVVRLFYPRAKRLHLPFALALVTSWLTEGNEPRHVIDRGENEEPIMTWSEAKEINNSELAEIIAHSDAMHYMTNETPAATEQLPAEATRQFLKEYDRPETTAEYERRIRLDSITCRRKLVEHGFRPPTIFAWPYGEGNQTAKKIHEEVGFTHFLLYDTPPVLATAESAREGIPRIPVLRPDELVPLVFPKENKESQRWWLAFLKVGRDSRSVALIDATLAQLTPETQNHPEAEISRAVVDYLRGNAASGTARLVSLRQAYPFDPTVTQAIDDTLKKFDGRPM